jgi:hypothetical protein
LRSSHTKAHFELGHDGKIKQVEQTTPLSGGKVKLEPTALGLTHASPAAAGAAKAPVTPSAPSKSSVSAAPEAVPAASASAPEAEVAPVAAAPEVGAGVAAAEVVHAPEPESLRQ